MPSTLERPTVLTTGFANAGPGQMPWQPVFSAPPETAFLVREVRAHFFPDNLITPSGNIMTFRTKGANLKPGTPGGDDVLHSFQVRYLAARRAGPGGPGPGCPAACRGVVHFSGLEGGVESLRGSRSAGWPAAHFQRDPHGREHCSTALQRWRERGGHRGLPREVAAAGPHGGGVRKPERSQRQHVPVDAALRATDGVDLRR